MAGSQINDPSPYPMFVMDLMDRVGLRCSHFWVYFFDRLLSCFMPTTKELQQPYIHLLYCLIAVPLLLLGTILFLPIGFCGCCMWLAVCTFRKSYRLSTFLSPKREESPEVKDMYSFGTANVCFLHEVLSRFNNMSETAWRSGEIGRNLANQQRKTRLVGQLC